VREGASLDNCVDWRQGRLSSKINIDQEGLFIQVSIWKPIIMALATI